MIDDPTDFQVKFRLSMLERMALRALLLSASRERSPADAHRDTVVWLESCIRLAGETAHGATRDNPALAELYEAEAREVISDLIAETNAIAKEIEAARKRD
jgi:hypothetical protein